MPLEEFLAGLSATLVGLATEYGLLGLFLGSLIANATIFLPVPFDLVVFGLGATADNPVWPFWVGVVAGIGAGIGELAGYYVGLLGRKTVQKRLPKDQLEKVDHYQRQVQSQGVVILFVTSLIPFPFDIVGIACGLIKYPVERFLAAVTLGKIGKHVLLGYAGYLGLGAVKAIFAIG